MFSVFDLLILSQIPNIGSNRLRTLISHFGEPGNVVHATAREIAAVDGFSRKLASQVASFFKNSKLGEAKRYAERQLSRLNKIDGHIITFWDKRYPDVLKKIYDPPTFLFVQGNFVEEDKYSIAIVGTRSPSSYGGTMAEKFASELVKLGITIVSGLARGIDTLVHSVALKNSGRTIAVIGSGLDVMYPPENKDLAGQIIQHGAIITEYEMGAKPDAGNFPRRNRIISGLTLGTLIIETDVGGGAMITANTALDQNREVFAIPGNINAKKSRGCNTLIKDGRAKLVESIDDIVTELASKFRPLLKGTAQVERKTPVDLTLFEKSIYDFLSETPTHIDTLSEQASIAISDTLVNLLSLEFKGLVKQLP